MTVSSSSSTSNVPRRKISGSSPKNFALNPLILDDPGRPQRAKIDRYLDQVFLVMFNLDLPPEGGAVVEHHLNICLGSRYRVTVYDELISEIDEAGRRWRENAIRIERNINVLFYSLLDTIVDHYVPLLDAIGDRVIAREESICTAAGRRRRARSSRSRRN